MYLTVKTLDNGEHGITCSTNGFYKNENAERSTFNPAPSTRFNNRFCFSYTLVGLLYQLSPQFGKNLQVYLNSVLKTEPYFLTQPSPMMTMNKWL
jgi:hypothetical protein